jgi:uncharacterized RDD family membrane protein YckC
MTDPAGGAPTPPPPSGNWQAPQPPQGGFNPNMQQAPVEAGPAPGIVYADVVTRIIALVIDSLILFVAYIIIAIVLAIFGGFVGWFLGSIVYFVGSAAYFVYTWTKQRATYGQKMMKLETVNAADGATLTQPQAIRRWAFMYGPAVIASIFSRIPAGDLGSLVILGTIGFLISILGLVYSLYLLYTTTQSPKRQGFHDVQAGTVVIKHL